MIKNGIKPKWWVWFKKRFPTKCALCGKWSRLTTENDHYYIFAHAVNPVTCHNGFVVSKTNHDS